jgi:hypothetical protein
MKALEEKLKPNLPRPACERTTSSEAISTTMPKMLSAHSTISQ